MRPNTSRKKRTDGDALAAAVVVVILLIAGAIASLGPEEDAQQPEPVSEVVG